MASSCGSSYASSEETTNYARMCRIVVDVLRDILWLVLTNEILPADLPQKVQIDIKKLGNLNSKIKTWLCGISPPSTEIPSAENFDISSLYTLIRNLCSQVPAPSTQWGQIPPAGGITLGDDIERVREFRNTLYGHATQAKIETVDFNKLCIEIKDVATRFDAYFCSLSKAMKCDFECEIDAVLTCFMDKSLEDDYIEKMKEIAILSDCVVDVQQKLGDLTKTVYNVEDVMYDLQKDGKENAEDLRNRLCRIQETLDDRFHMEKEKDKVENTTDSSVNEERDCNENAGNSREDMALEMPQGMDGKICIIKCYADLKRELEKGIMMDIARDLFQKEKHQDVLEEIDKAGRRRHCIDQFLKRVLQLKATRLKIFLDLLKRKCRERAQKLAEIKVTDKDRENFTQVSESVQEVPHRIQDGLKFEPLDVKFFQRHFQDIPEKVDYRADLLLSQFRISICDHSQLIKENDSVKKIHALLEKIQSCHFDSDSEVESVLGSKLYQKWQSFRGDGSRQGLENQGIWHYIQERIQSSKEYVITLFRGLGLFFMQANRGSLVLKFVTLDNFDVKLLKPEAVKTKLWDMIKTLCPEYQDVFTEPVHLTIFSKPLSNTDSAEIYFYLETRKEKEEFSCMKLGSYDKQSIMEEIGPVSLTNWMCNTELDEDTKTKLVDLVSKKDMSRRKKMKILLNIVESLGNGYELLEKYCEEHDTFLYNEVFKKHREMMVEENPDGAQQYEFSEEGLQRLSSTWIDFTEDPKGKEEDRTCSVEREEMRTKEQWLMSYASDQPFSLNKNPSHSAEVFNDPIHGHIELHPLCVKIIDTPQFQRLRNIKQLGGVYFVFPGASHNRFEHSLGVCHLAGELARALQRNQPELDISDKDVLCVQIAGLCHDLGHGPYSHLFDRNFIPLLRQDKKWKHEDASVEMFDYLIEDNSIPFQEYGLDEQDITFIKEQIVGPNKETKDQEWPHEGRSNVKSFLYEIVANKRNGIDVDKWDYFSRDCHMLGIRNSFDHNRFLHFARVLKVDGQLQICYRDKEAVNLCEMFHTRNVLHRRAYQHKTTKIIETMIIEAMIKANDYITYEGKDGRQLKMSETIDDMVAYSKMTDSVLYQILNSSSDDELLSESKQILQNIYRRKLYKFVAQTQITDEDLIKDSEIDSIKKEIVDNIEESEESRIQPEDIIIHLIYLDYGMKDKNPIDNVRFYMKEKPDIAVRVRKDQVSQMLPEKFAEQQLRVYYKKDDKPSIHKVLQSFEQWCKKENFPPPKGKNLTEPEMTPDKKNPATMSSGTPSHKADKKNPETPGSAGKFKSKLSFK